MTAQYGPTTTFQEVSAGHDLTGKRAVVTGASAGLGAQTALALARLGADLVLAVRDSAAGEAVADRIDRECGRRAYVEALDLADLSSVRVAAQRISREPVDILVNNAGVMATPFGLTTEGFETQLGINHLGHFLFTTLLMDALVAAAPARVVNLTSAGHIWSDVDLDDLHFRTRPYDPWVAYGQSKTANILFSVELTRRYGERGVSANAVMPGRIGDTRLSRHTTSESLKLLPVMSVGAPGPDAPANTLPKTLDQGIATTIWAVVASELEGKGGLYLEDCAIALPWSADNPRRGVKDYALDPARARRLWEISEPATMP